MNQYPRLHELFEMAAEPSKGKITMNWQQLLQSKTFWAAIALGIVHALVAQGILAPALGESIESVLIALGLITLRVAVQKSGPPSAH